MRITLFFTRGTSLADWERGGSFDRETSLYLRFRELGHEPAFITYGGKGELAFGPRLGGIEIRRNPSRVPLNFYEWLIPFFHGKTLVRSDIIKSNQTYGAEIALRAARMAKKPFVARCGFMFSEFEARAHGPDSELAREAREVEQKVFTRADRIIVTTPMMRDNIADRFPRAESRIAVIPNFVRTDMFAPLPDQAEKEYDAVFVGRMVEQKNPAALLRAASDLGIRLLMIGTGPLLEELKREYVSDRIEWLDKVDHADLPGRIGRARVFVLPSHYEGHPKTLIEAMSCGACVLAADSPGIREVVSHDADGFLCGTSPEDIGRSLKILLESSELRERLGRAAREKAVREYSLHRVADRELGLYRKLLAEKHSG